MVNQEALKEFKDELIVSEVLPDLYKLMPKKHVIVNGKTFVVRHFKQGKVQVYCALLSYYDGNYFSNRRDLEKRLRKKGVTTKIFIHGNTKDACRYGEEFLRPYLESMFPEKFKALLAKKKIIARAQKKLQKLQREEEEELTAEALLLFEDRYEVNRALQDVIEHCLNKNIIEYSLGSFNRRTCSFPITLKNVPKTNLFAKALYEEDNWDYSNPTLKELHKAIDELGIDKQVLATGLLTSENPSTRLLGAGLSKSPVLALLDPDKTVRRYVEIKLGKIPIPKKFQKKVEKLWGSDFQKETP